MQNKVQSSNPYLVGTSHQPKVKIQTEAFMERMQKKHNEMS